MSQTDYQKYEYTINAVRGSLKRWEEIKINSRADKTGFGWNNDSRFSSLKIELAFTNWVGYYGNSSCSTWMSFGDEALFKEAFIKVMDRRALALFSEVADELEHSSQAAKAQEITKLKERLAKLEAK